MKISGNTILITEGDTELGRELAKLMSKYGNEVIIAGNDVVELEKTAACLKNTTFICYDKFEKNSPSLLADEIRKRFPGLNILVNNMSAQEGNSFGVNQSGLARARNSEFQTSFFFTMELISELLQVLTNQSAPAIINIPSAAVFSSAGLKVNHLAAMESFYFYTHLLRQLLEENSPVKVFEVVPPSNVEFFNKMGIATNKVPAHMIARTIIKRLKYDEFEIRVDDVPYLD